MSNKITVKDKEKKVKNAQNHVDRYSEAWVPASKVQLPPVSEIIKSSFGSSIVDLVFVYLI